MKKSKTVSIIVFAILLLAAIIVNVIVGYNHLIEHHFHGSETFNKIEYVKNSDGREYVYGGVKYIKNQHFGHISEDNNELDLIAWRFMTFPFSLLVDCECYSYAKDNPTYIYTYFPADIGGDYYLSEEFDYLNETYTLYGTDYSVVLKDIFVKDDVLIQESSILVDSIGQFILKSNSVQDLAFIDNIYERDGKYYISHYNSDIKRLELYHLTPEFESVLRENKDIWQY